MPDVQEIEQFLDNETDKVIQEIFKNINSIDTWEQRNGTVGIKFDIVSKAIDDYFKGDYSSEEYKIFIRENGEIISRSILASKDSSNKEMLETYIKYGVDILEEYDFSILQDVFQSYLSDEECNKEALQAYCREHSKSCQDIIANEIIKTQENDKEVFKELIKYRLYRCYN